METVIDGDAARKAEAHRGYALEYYWRNRERIRAYRVANRAKGSAQVAAWRERNREKALHKAQGVDVPIMRSSAVWYMTGWYPCTLGQWASKGWVPKLSKDNFGLYFTHTQFRLLIEFSGFLELLLAIPGEDHQSKIDEFSAYIFKNWEC